MGFFRQEYWSGLPCPSPGIFSTQGTNPGLPHCRQTVYQLSYSGICLSIRESQFFSSVQSLSRVRLCDPMNCSTPGVPVHHQLLEFTQTHVHRVGDAIQPSHPLSSPSPCTQSFPAPGSFPMSQLFTSGGQGIGVSASASVLPMNTQD